MVKTRLNKSNAQRRNGMTNHALLTTLTLVTYAVFAGMAVSHAVRILMRGSIFESMRVKIAERRCRGGGWKLLSDLFSCELCLSTQVALWFAAVIPVVTLYAVAGSPFEVVFGIHLYWFAEIFLAVALIAGLTFSVGYVAWHAFHSAEYSKNLAEAARDQVRVFEQTSRDFVEVLRDGVRALEASAQATAEASKPVTLAEILTIEAIEAMSGPIAKYCHGIECPVARPRCIRGTVPQEVERWAQKIGASQGVTMMLSDQLLNAWMHDTRLYGPPLSTNKLEQIRQRVIAAYGTEVVTPGAPATGGNGFQSPSMGGFPIEVALLAALSRELEARHGSGVGGYDDLGDRRDDRW